MGPSPSLSSNADRGKRGLSRWNLLRQRLEGMEYSVLSGLYGMGFVFRFWDGTLVVPVWSSYQMRSLCAGFTVLSHRHASQVEGMWALHMTLAIGHLSLRRARGRERGFVMKHLGSGERVLFGSVHLVPGMTQDNYAAAAEGFLAGMPKNHRRVVVQGGFNSPFAWVQNETGDIACGLDGQALLTLDLLAGAGRLTCWLAKGFYIGGVRYSGDSCFSLNTDHELPRGTFELRGKRIFSRPTTRPRVWTGGLSEIQGISVEQLGELAQNHTKPVPSRAYCDSKAIREAFQAAKLSKSRDQWKMALRARRQARREWNKIGCAGLRSVTGGPLRT